MSVKSSKKPEFVTKEELTAVVSEIDARLLKIEKGLSDLVTVLSEAQKKAGGEGGGVAPILTVLAQKALAGGPSPFEKLAIMSMVDNVTFTRIFQRSILSSMGKEYAKQYAKVKAEVIKSLFGEKKK